MTKTVEEVRRELFENEYVQYRQFLKRNKDGSHNQEWVEARWQGFNAALDAVEIELPEPHSTNGGDCVIDYDETLAAIEQTGLGLRIK